MSLTTINLTTEAFSTPVEPASHWQLVAARRRKEIQNAIPSEYALPSQLFNRKSHIDLPQTCGLLSNRELSITAFSATALLQRIHSRTYTAVEVAAAFCKRAAIAHQAVGLWIKYLERRLLIHNRRIV